MFWPAEPYESPIDFLDDTILVMRPTLLLFNLTLPYYAESCEQSRLLKDEKVSEWNWKNLLGCLARHSLLKLVENQEIGAYLLGLVVKLILVYWSQLGVRVVRG
jgi:hypothetical protein